MAEILSSIKVLDLSRYLAGPLCASILADMGATVYKVERPTVGDDYRHLGPFRKESGGDGVPPLSAAFMAGNRGKQSITIDIATPDGAQLVRELASQCDVVVENYKVGGLKKYGLDYASISAVKPDIVYCSVTGFGQDGPYAPRPAFDSVIQAMSGLMSVCGHADEPMRSQALIADTTAGLYSAIAVLGALMHRRETGEGQHIDLGMLDTSVTVCGLLALGYLMNGAVPERNGNSNPNAAPSDVLRTQDGYLLVVCGNEGQFRALCEVLGRSDLPKEDRFSTNASRLANRSAMQEALEQALKTRTSAEWAVALEAAGVPCGAINTMHTVFQDPQVQHRRVRIDVPYGDGTMVPTLHSPMRFSKTPVVHRGPPVLGEFTDRILTTVLGRTQAQIDALRAAKVI